MKTERQEPKPNQFKEKYVVIGYFPGGEYKAFGTPSGRSFHGDIAADRAVVVLKALHPGIEFHKIEILPYLEVAPTPVAVV